MTSTPPPADSVVRPVGQRLLPGNTAGAITVVGLQECHWPAVREIYAAGIATGQATFESRPPGWEAFAAGRPAHLRQGRMSHGPQAGQWRDVILLERRSDTVGT